MKHHYDHDHGSCPDCLYIESALRAAVSAYRYLLNNYVAALPTCVDEMHLRRIEKIEKDYSHILKSGRSGHETP